MEQTSSSALGLALLDAIEHAKAYNRADVVASLEVAVEMHHAHETARLSNATVEATDNVP